MDRSAGQRAARDDLGPAQAAAAVEHQDAELLDFAVPEAGDEVARHLGRTLKAGDVLVGGIAGAAAQLEGGGQPDEPRPGKPGPVRQMAQRRLAERRHAAQIVEEAAGEPVPTRPEHEAEQFGAGQGSRAVLEEPVGGRVGRDAPAARRDPRSG